MRRHRLLTVLVMLISLLFMQLAVASYACPGLAIQGHAKVQTAGAALHAGMPCAESMGLAEPMAMDEQLPALCHADCQDGKQMSDGHQIQLPAMAPDHVAAYVILPAAALPSGQAPQAPLLARAAAPPLSIRHCCFRI